MKGVEQEDTAALSQRDGGMSVQQYADNSL
jgi:hypothetical protein